VIAVAMMKNRMHHNGIFVVPAIASEEEIDDDADARKGEE
jgi:hypothetical protein